MRFLWEDDVLFFLYKGIQDTNSTEEERERCLQLYRFDGWELYSPMSDRAVLFILDLSKHLWMGSL